MTDIKRSWDFISEESREKYIKEIINFFQTERSEEVGVIAAGELLDLFLREAGKDIYNGAIEDSRKLSKEQSDDLNYKFDLLIKQ